MNDRRRLAEQWAADVFGARPVNTETLASEVYCLSFPDGSRKIAKLQTALTFEQLECAYRLQEVLRRRGFPCARLAAGPVELSPGLVAVCHDYFAPGEPHNGATPEHRRSIAEGLATIVNFLACESFDALREVRPHRETDLANTPPSLHQPMLRASAVISRARLDVAAHIDWRARNLRFQQGRLAAAYDFDSLARVSEAAIVGSTSALFMGGPGKTAINLDPRVALGFVREYESARGKKFSPADMTVVRAGAVYGLTKMAKFVLGAGVAPEARLVPAIMGYEKAAEMMFRQPG